MENKLLLIGRFYSKGVMQNIGHVQHTDTQINGNNIDNINTKHKTDQKHRLKHAQRRQKHKATFNIREPIQPGTGSKKL